jgi:SM-20-related protein
MGPLPPHGRLGDFLPPEERDALLSWVLGQEQHFTPAMVKPRGEDGAAKLDAVTRVALKLRAIGPLEQQLRTRLLAALPAAMHAAGSSGPEPRSLELELTAYGDGAFYAPHLDIPVGPDRRPLGNHPGEDRMISAVYYFHREPKRFAGGALRLFRFGVADDSPGGFVDLPPEQNSLLLFPSWARHEVRPVECPGGSFADYRFALNCWYCRAL